jgi:putative transposase
MPWKETDSVNERMKFIAACKSSEEVFAVLCERFEISRKTGYKWLNRYDDFGPKGLEDRSSAPLTHPHAVSEQMNDRVLAIRRKHSRWGPKKIRVILGRETDLLTASGILLPASSTIGEILRRNGLSARRKRVRRSSPYGTPLGGYEHPNSIWCADFKGSFLVKSGIRCSPLTISDGYSRKVLRCTGLTSTTTSHTKRTFVSAFREFGLPDAIRTDNGPPFSSLAVGGLSQLAIWWIRLGIRPERIEPGRPDQNGRHERMHRTLKDETARPPRANMSAQQRAFDRFVTDYNEVRPHEALGQRTPESLYRPSLTRYSEGPLPELEYPDRFRVLKTYSNGVISFGSTQWLITGCLRNQRVGLEEVDQDRWRVYFGPLALGTIDMRKATLRSARRFGSLSKLEGAALARRKPYGR